MSARFVEGERVVADAPIEGTVVAVFCRQSGDTYVVVEDDRGGLHVHDHRDLELI